MCRIRDTKAWERGLAQTGPCGWNTLPLFFAWINLSASCRTQGRCHLSEMPSLRLPG